MTRASDRLILCSFRKKREVEGTWAKIAKTALEKDNQKCVDVTFRAGSLEWQGMTWRHTAERAETAAEPVRADEKPIFVIPAALHQKLPAQKTLPRPLAPSGVHVVIDDQEGENIVTSALFAEKKRTPQAQIRGKIVHRLLQTLPEFGADERMPAAHRYLERAVPHWPEEERQAVADRVLAILEDARFAPLHDETSQAEVSVMGTIRLGERDYAVSGRLDRMGVRGDDVFILDYKTNLVRPATGAEIPFAHKAQLALYREVLKPIFPGKSVHCLLIYTEGPHLYSLAVAELEKALLAISRQ